MTVEDLEAELRYDTKVKVAGIDADGVIALGVAWALEPDAEREKVGTVGEAVGPAGFGGGKRLRGNEPGDDREQDLKSQI